METTARVRAKGRITLPKSVRDALGLEEGDTVTFRVEEGRVVLAGSPDLLGLAGLVSVPVDVRSLPWEQVRAQAWEARAREAAQK